MKGGKCTKNWCGWDSNPGPRGFVAFRAALVTARADGKTLTWIGKETIHSETVTWFRV